MNFLLEHKWNTRDFYMPDTQTNKASQCINSLRLRYKEINMFAVGDMKTGRRTHPEAQWYLDLLRSLKVRIFLPDYLNLLISCGLSS